MHVVCPSFFQTNLLDSFRGPTPNVKAQIGKLLESSPITAADIADYIHQQVAKGEFMILPHEEGRMAWKVKQQNPQAIYDEMALLAESGPRARPSESGRPLPSSGRCGCLRGGWSRVACPVSCRNPMDRL